MEQIAGHGVVLNGKHRLARIYRNEKAFVVEVDMIFSSEFNDLKDSELYWKMLTEIEEKLKAIE